MINFFWPYHMTCTQGISLDVSNIEVALHITGSVWNDTLTDGKTEDSNLLRFAVDHEVWSKKLIHAAFRQLT